MRGKGRGKMVLGRREMGGGTICRERGREGGMCRK